ncbi:hypothetical protein ACLHDF_27415 [Priestia aryabhattai]|uniref:hypothetical protein n=1 Tax=Priestia megaterium TaxID=1404 RepID=UPI0039B82B32
MGDNQSNDLEQILENNIDEAELNETEKEFVTKSTKPSYPYPYKYYTGDVPMVSKAVPRNDKE